MKEINYKDPCAVRKAGMAALEKELGSVGTAYFLRQLQAGSGNYTIERDQLLPDVTLEELFVQIEQFDKKDDLCDS